MNPLWSQCRAVCNWKTFPAQFFRFSVVVQWISLQFLCIFMFHKFSFSQCTMSNIVDMLFVVWLQFLWLWHTFNFKQTFFEFWIDDWKNVRASSPTLAFIACYRILININSPLSDFFRFIACGMFQVSRLSSFVIIVVVNFITFLSSILQEKEKKRKMMHTSCHRCSGIRTWLIIYAKSANDSRWVWSFAMICYDEWNRRGMLIGFIKGQTEEHSRASRYDNNDVSKLIDSLDIIRRPFVDGNFLLQHFFDVYLKIFDFTAHDVDSWQRSATAVEQWNEDGDDDWKIVDEREKKISEQRGDWSKAKYRRAVKMKWEICEMRTMAVKIPYFRGSRLSSWTFR